MRNKKEILSQAERLELNDYPYSESVKNRLLNALLLEVLIDIRDNLSQIEKRNTEIGGILERIGMKN